MPPRLSVVALQTFVGASALPGAPAPYLFGCLRTFVREIRWNLMSAVQCHTVELASSKIKFAVRPDLSASAWRSSRDQVGMSRGIEAILGLLSGKNEPGRLGQSEGFSNNRCRGSSNRRDAGMSQIVAESQSVVQKRLKKIVLNVTIMLQKSGIAMCSG